MMNVVKKRKIWFAFSGILVVLSLISIIAYGLNLGIDFTGGSLMRLQFSEQRLTNDEIREAIYSGAEEGENLEEKYGNATVQPLGENEVLIKLKPINEPTHSEILTKIRDKARELSSVGEKEEAQVGEDESQEGQNEEEERELVTETKFESIGPTIGQELREKAISMIGLVLLIIVIYVAFTFKAVSNEFNKYESFRYGIVAIVALLHDVIIVLGVFAFLGAFLGVEINTFFIAAILTILGYSVNDTIIVLDRIRENVLKSGHSDFAETVNKSIKEVMTRSIYTSLTTLAVLFSILILGGETTFYFVLALIIGIAIGTYSSIFLASQLLVVWKERSK